RLGRGGGPRRAVALLLRAPALGRQGVGRPRTDVGGRAGALRVALRAHPGPRPRALRRPGRDRRLPRLRQGLRRGARRVRRAPRLPERTRLRRAPRSREARRAGGRARLLNGGWTAEPGRSLRPGPRVLLSGSRTDGEPL